jgi:hypothetical protein
MNRVRKVTEQFSSLRGIRGGGFVDRVEPTEFIAFSAPLNLGAVASGLRLKMHTFDATLRRGEVAIGAILRPCAFAQIGAAIVQTIAVYMVDLITALSGHEKAVHIKESALSGASRIASRISILSSLVKMPLVRGNNTRVRIIERYFLRTNSNVSHAPLYRSNCQRQQ